METWKLLAWTAGLLVLWAALVSLLGHDLTPWSVMFAAVFGMAGFYVTARVMEQWGPSPDED